MSSQLATAAQTLPASTIPAPVAFWGSSDALLASGFTAKSRKKFAWNLLNEIPSPKDRGAGTARHGGGAT